MAWSSTAIFNHAKLFSLTQHIWMIQESREDPRQRTSFTTSFYYKKRRSLFCSLDCSQRAGVEAQSFVDLYIFSFSGQHFYFFCIQDNYHSFQAHDCTWHTYKAMPVGLKFRNLIREYINTVIIIKKNTVCIVTKIKKKFKIADIPLSPKMSFQRKSSDHFSYCLAWSPWHSCHRGLIDMRNTETQRHGPLIWAK